MFQTEFLKQIKKHLPKNISLIDAVATALDISYDAAHRRTSAKSKLSLNESVILAKHYNLSIDRLFGTTNVDFIAVEKTKQIHNEMQLQEYFKASCASLRPLITQKESRVLYSAKDIPIFYTLGNDKLSRFKIYVWLKLLDLGFSASNFEQFSPKLDTLKHANALGNLYQNLNTTEIWDITTVNSTLKQIHFYHGAGQVSTQAALELCEGLKTLVNSISNKVNPDSETYKFYYNELLLMNNNVLVCAQDQCSLYVPFSILSYYLTSDVITCNQAETYLKRQLQHSKLLNTAGEREKCSFFNRIHEKIDALAQLIKASKVLDFE